MDALHHWRLCDELTVLQAALLIVGEDPSVSQEFVQNWETTNRPSGYDAAFAALKNAILSNRLPATIRHAATERGWIRDPMNHEAVGTDSRNVQIFYNIDPSWDRTTVYVEDLRAWLRTRGVIGLPDLLYQFIVSVARRVLLISRRSRGCGEVGSA
jgi:hypothetical protein